MLIIWLQYIFVFAQSENPVIDHQTNTISHIPMTIDRPDQTESPYVIPHKFTQIEIGVDYQWDHYTSDHIAYTYRSANFPNLLLRYGIAKGIELRLEANYGIDRLKSELKNQEIKINGMHPVGVGAKIKLLAQKGLWPSISLLLKIHTPLHSRKDSKSNIRYSPEITGAFSYAFSEKVVLDGSVGASIDQYTGKLYTNYSLSQAWNFSGKLSLFVEMYGSKSIKAFAQYGADAGLLYLLSPHLQVDIFTGKSFSYQAIDQLIGVGFGLRIPDK